MRVNSNFLLTTLKVPWGVFRLHAVLLTKTHVCVLKALQACCIHSFSHKTSPGAFFLSTNKISKIFWLSYRRHEMRGNDMQQRSSWTVSSPKPGWPLIFFWILQSAYLHCARPCFFACSLLLCCLRWHSAAFLDLSEINAIVRKHCKECVLQCAHVFSRKDQLCLILV